MALILVGLGLILVAVRVYFNGASCTSKARLDGKSLHVSCCMAHTSTVQAKQGLMVRVCMLVAAWHIPVLYKQSKA